MVDEDKHRPTVGGPPEDTGEELPYRVELWSTDKTSIERLLARAASIALGQAIFAAARREYPDRRITLSDSASTIIVGT